MDRPAPTTTTPLPGNRLALALQLSLQFRAAGRTDVDAFLAAHDAMRDLIEPMIRADDGDVARDAAAAEPARSAPTGFSPGANVAGYVIERRLGQGGMGTVFLATQASLGRRVALKVLSAPLALLGERSRWRFQRESRLLAELDHPGIVRVLEASTVGDLPFYAMEFVDGAPLSAVLDAIRRAGLRGATATTVRAALLGALGGDDTTAPAPRADARDFTAVMVDIAAQVAEALAHAHAAGVVHRDVKPSNVLLRRDGKALLADFGIARREGGARMTVTGDLAGTPTYMSPEQARGEPIDHRADVFSLGVMLYECLTLQVPFGGDTHGAVLAALQTAEPGDPRRHNPQVSADLWAVVGKALQKNPDHRYATAHDLAADLRAVLRGDPVSARRASRWQRVRRWARREPWRAIAAIAAMLAVITGAVAAMAFTRQLVDDSQRSAAALAEVQRLAIGVRIDRAEATAQAFRIARIELVPAMQQWLREQGEPLAAELPRLRAMRDGLAEQALPYDEPAAAADRERHPDYPLLRRLDDELAHLALPAVGVDSAQYDAKRRQSLLVTAEPIRARVAERRTWRFVDEQTQFLHDQVAELVVRLERFANAQDGWLPRVQRQLAWAEESQRRCQVEGMAAWQTAIASIAATQVYHGLVLRPQWDLLPLGPDPRSGLWEFVHLRSGARNQEIPTRDAQGAILPNGDMAIVFVLIPGGLATMGAQATDPTAPNHDPMAGPYEVPVHTVELGPFLLAKYETTQGQWLRLSDGGVPSLYKMGTKLVTGQTLTPQYPVESISYRDATRVLGQHGLTLPTEAQWEYACRAGTSTPWHFGTRDRAPQFANLADQAAMRAGARWPCEEDLDDGHAVNAPVGSFQPNAFGLFDMHGNAGEITADHITQYTRPTDPGTGRRHIPYDAKSIVFRGGSHGFGITPARSADRQMSESADFRASWLGVRAARAID